MGLGDPSFCQIGLWIFPVGLLGVSPCVLEVGLLLDRIIKVSCRIAL